jgi:hypothetical protein
MPYPFPGMNPYLEQPAFWSSVHSRLIVALADAIAPQILPNYYIEVETRTYSEDTELLIGIPDAVILTKAASEKSPQIFSNSSGIALQNRPQMVQIPNTYEVKERYLAFSSVAGNNAPKPIYTVSICRNQFPAFPCLSKILKNQSQLTYKTF